MYMLLQYTKSKRLDTVERTVESLTHTMASTVNNDDFGSLLPAQRPTLTRHVTKYIWYAIKGYLLGIIST